MEDYKANKECHQQIHEIGDGIMNRRIGQEGESLYISNSSIDDVLDGKVGHFLREFFDGVRHGFIKRSPTKYCLWQE